MGDDTPAAKSAAGPGPAPARDGLALCWHNPAMWWFWGIVALAAALRLARLDLIEFKADEAGHLLRALEILEQHRLPLAGSQASLGVAKPPLMSLLMALPLLLGRDPRLASGFIAALNVAAVAGTFLLARRYYSLQVAVVAAGLFAVNPWAVVFSRKVFTADVLAPFLVVFLYGLHAGLLEGKVWGWFGAVLGLSLACLITFTPLPLGPGMLVLLVIYRQRVAWRHLAAGAGASLLLFLPYLYGQRGHINDFLDLARKAAGGGHGEGGSPLAAMQYATWLHSGLNLGALSGRSFAAFLPTHSPLAALYTLEAGLFVASLVAVALLAFGGRSGQRTRACAILALCTVLPLALVSLERAGLEPHYLVILYPAGFLAMGVLYEQAWTALGRRLRPLACALGLALAAVALWEAASVAYLYAFVAGHDTAGGYGPTLRRWQPAVALTRAQVQAAGLDEAWIITQGSDPATGEAPAVLQYLLGPDVRTVFLGQGGNEALLLPLNRPAVYLLTRSVPAPVTAMLEALHAEERGTAPWGMGKGRARVLYLPAHSPGELAALMPQTATGRLEAGLSLLGYAWPADAQAGGKAFLCTFWAFGDVPAGEYAAAHSFFSHLVTADGTRVAQHDGMGLPEASWRPGLLLAQWSTLDLPADLVAGDYAILTGLYRLDDGQRSRVITVADSAAGDAIRLGPVAIAR